MPTSEGAENARAYVELLIEWAKRHPELIPEEPSEQAKAVNGKASDRFGERQSDGEVATELPRRVRFQVVAQGRETHPDGSGLDL